jgi:hypothetical protein
MRSFVSHNTSVAFQPSKVNSLVTTAVGRTLGLHSPSAVIFDHFSKERT